MDLGTFVGIVALIVCGVGAWAFIGRSSVRGRKARGQPAQTELAGRQLRELVGLVSLGFGLAVGVGLLSGIVDWMRLAPESYLVYCLSSDEPEIVAEVVDEVERRARSGKPSSDGGRFVAECVTSLAGRADHGQPRARMQMESLLMSLLKLELDVVGETHVGEGLTCRVSCEELGTLPESWWYWVRGKELLVDGSEVARNVIVCASAYSDLGYVAFSRPVSLEASVGEHLLELKGTCQVYRGEVVGSEELGVYIGEYDFLLQQEFEIAERKTEESLQAGTDQDNRGT